MKIKILYISQLILFFLAITICSMLLSNTVQAQKNPSFVGINAGLANPYGKFKSTDLSDGSFAMMGMNVNLDGAWFFKPKFGVGASVGINLNPVNVSVLGWEKVLEDPFLNDVTIRSDPYFTLTAMAGMYTHLPIIHNLSFNGKILAGLLYGATPYQLYKPDYFVVGPPYYEKTSAKDWKFSWQAGAGFQYDVSSCIGIVFETTILYDKLSFNFLTATGIRTDVHTIALINTTLGIRIAL